ncbi:conserved hypothetical protein [Trichormus variabilis ATCC 29413]|uniref:Uncharacterized protein n=3 Tax=Anabaena variabilis TaxID=264691 RepID=Q3MDD4_TRIV2|nr:MULTISPECIES: hypothetical protein [Nostocaceae]ABA21002.1 conserved hypothetical protein [Trichormus variabilis ATCC 29413]MBC1214152.1 hypothetical protein [Trichormus variabilis ARAD]MBC1269736.1 hypothetical protein [Trichormus variabilis FSR]MBC1300675.1 hypothetical protein [Trichormus variabilis N2B]MBC1310501.1 hypothetical protein [Trichormus variabilis PNB]
MSIPLAFIICTEPGRLESQSLMLASSIRKFCGNLKDTPIYSFHPRVGEPISHQTQEAFAALQVIHQQIPINQEFHEYYLANKPLVCAYAEQNIDAEILVFLDSDKCLFAEPTEFLLPENCNVRVRPEYGQGIGSTGSQDPQEWYWQRLYQVLGVKREIFVNTPIGNKRIRAYWNSGLVAVRRSAGIFTAWKENFTKVMHLDITPPQGIYFVEQSVLSVTLCALVDNIEHFSLNYSYPLPLHNRLSPELRLQDWDDITSIHYFNLFFYNDWNTQIKKLKKFNITSDKYKWLSQEVVRLNMSRTSVLHRYMLAIRRIEQKLQKFNIKINLSSLIEKTAKF